MLTEKEELSVKKWRVGIQGAIARLIAHSDESSSYSSDSAGYYTHSIELAPVLLQHPIVPTGEVDREEDQK